MSLTQASRQLHTSPKTVLKYTNAFRKLKGKWIVKTYDTISRPPMRFYENGEEKWIDVSDSRTASTIGKYHNAVRKFFETGNTDALQGFKDPIKDAHGVVHYFETDPDRLTIIIEAQAYQDFWIIYLM